jgi:hypothetical protein
MIAHSWRWSSRRGGNLLNQQRRSRADLVSAARLGDLFGQRWKSETVISVINANSKTPSALAWLGYDTENQ